MVPVGEGGAETDRGPKNRKTKKRTRSTRTSMKIYQATTPEKLSFEQRGRSSRAQFKKLTAAG